MTFKRKKPNLLKRDLTRQKKAENAQQLTDLQLRNTAKASSRRPGRGTGVSGDDLWQPSARTGAYVPDDDRLGKLLCKDCGEEVVHVEVDGKWQVRNPEDNLPHALTCRTIED